MMTFKRRTMLAAAAMLTATTALWPGADALAQTTLTLGHGAAPGNPRSVAAERFAELVAEKTSGEVTVTVAGSEQLGNDVAMLTSLRSGTLDFTINSQGAVSGVVPELAALGLPFLFETADDAVEVLRGPVGEELDEKFAAIGVVPLDWWDNGIRHISTRDRAVETPDDVQGLRIRTPADPMTIDIFEAVGAATEQIAFSELYVALQQGVVDGQENPLANIASSKLHEVTPNISLSGHKWESTPFLMSQIAVGRLSEEQMAAVRDAAMEAGELQRQLMREADEKHLAEFQDNEAVTVTQADRDAFREATAGVYEEWQSKEFGDFVGRLIEAASE